MIFESLLLRPLPHNSALQYISKPGHCVAHISIQKLLNWAILISVFAVPSLGNPILDFCKKLQKIKSNIKPEKWASSSSLSSTLNDLHQQQSYCMPLLESDPECLPKWKTESQSKWLKYGEDDLKFLYSKIRVRKNCNQISVYAALAELSNPHSNAIHNIMQHFTRSKENLNMCAKTFADSSGLHFNLKKSSRMLSPNTPSSGDTCNALSIPSPCSKITYLGLPISTKRIKLADFSPILDSILISSLVGCSLLGILFGIPLLIGYLDLSYLSQYVCSLGESALSYCILLIQTQKNSTLSHGLIRASLKSLVVLVFLPFLLFSLVLTAPLSAKFTTPKLLCLTGFLPYASLLGKLLSHHPRSFGKAFVTLLPKLNIKSLFRSQITHISLLWDHWCLGGRISEKPYAETILNYYPSNTPLAVLISYNTWNLPCDADRQISDGIL
ncbi:hypothetical protein M5K25_018031 [Dendrobium thyrsiflorum]|uniref:Uncharacterized protein n=1 Tax=Dendrobium thyrsiflorum TaxID=117978 RepID=A0ABD0UHE4_DENTH